VSYLIDQVAGLVIDHTELAAFAPMAVLVVSAAAAAAAMFAPWRWDR
jgi:hypothetical protein